MEQPASVLSAPPRPVPPRPWVTWTLLGAILLLGLAVTLDEAVLGNPASLVELGAKERVLIEGGEWWRLLAAAFLHQGALHLLVNGYALWILGTFCELFYGRSRFLLIYLGGALGGSVASFRYTEAMSVGASGAIFGLLGAAIVFGFRHKAELPPHLGRRMRLTLLFWLGVNLVLGALIPVIDNWGHLGGLVAGTVLALALGDASFARRAPSPALRLAAAAGAAVAIAALGLGVWNRLTVSYPTLVVWALAGEELEAGEPGAALVTLDQARAEARGREPWLPLIELDRARALGAIGDEEGAASLTDSIVAAGFGRLGAPWAVEAAVRLGELGRYPAAERLYLRVLDRRSHPTAANNLAWMYLTAGDAAFRQPAAALPLAERAVEREPDNPFFLGTLGAAQLEAGEIRPAVENLRRAVALHERADQGTDLYLLATALARLGSAEEAREVLAEAVNRFPDDPFRREAERAVRRPAVSL